jgi:hypothetical protein
VALGALTATHGGAGSLSSGAMGLAALTTLDNASAETTSPDAGFSQSASAVFSGVGTGSAQSITFDYVFSASATTVDPPPSPPQGDEGALRMGLDSTLNQFSADDHPGVGLRNINTDGIFVLFRLVEAPEPDTALLLGFGLALLAWHRRADR